jgi:hypothetical protein
MSSPAQMDDQGPLQLDKPVPRPPKSADKQAQIHIQNRRREYLQRHPSYLENKEHELAGKCIDRTNSFGDARVASTNGVNRTHRSCPV